MARRRNPQDAPTKSRPRRRLRAIDLSDTPYEYAYSEPDGTTTYVTREEAVGLSPSTRETSSARRRS